MHSSHDAAFDTLNNVHTLLLGNRLYSRSFDMPRFGKASDFSRALRTAGSDLLDQHQTGRYADAGQLIRSGITILRRASLVSASRPLSQRQTQRPRQRLRIPLRSPAPCGQLHRNAGVALASPQRIGAHDLTDIDRKELVKARTPSLNSP